MLPSPDSWCRRRLGSRSWSRVSCGAQSLVCRRSAVSASAARRKDFVVALFGPTKRSRSRGRGRRDAAIARRRGSSWAGRASLGGVLRIRPRFVASPAPRRQPGDRGSQLMVAAVVGTQLLQALVRWCRGDDEEHLGTMTWRRGHSSSSAPACVGATVAGVSGRYCGARAVNVQGRSGAAAAR